MTARLEAWRTGWQATCQASWQAACLVGWQAACQACKAYKQAGGSDCQAGKLAVCDWLAGCLAGLGVNARLAGWRPGGWQAACLCLAGRGNLLDGWQPAWLGWLVRLPAWRRVWLAAGLCEIAWLASRLASCGWLAG